ncbi:phosphate propanoyltransferase [Heliobacillus mobilis]|uniref:Phosphate propanoyltransferase n=1 Tax=Heliobacterium mobile TaxID=28064 RepID=A0A6I3SG16_HELMO|nr:phosphate propanoyltransferase [Heliobacterium mobile]
MRGKESVLELVADKTGTGTIKQVSVGISNRHFHLAKEDLVSLFGEGYEPVFMKDLSQPGQYATKDAVTLMGPKGLIEGVRLLMPLRKQSQVEISVTDCYKLGIPPVIRDSGDLKDTPGITLVGPKGEVALPEGAIVAARHIHLNPQEASQLGVKDKQRISVEVGGPRGVRFDQVLIRVHESFASEMHVDTDEANGALMKNGQFVNLLL